MKSAFLILISIAGAVFAGCGDGASANNVKASLPGTYVRASQHEYGKEFDTIAVSLQNDAANEFKLNRRWRYARVLDGKPIEPEYKNTTTTAVYEESSKQLKEAETGDTYTFDAATKVLFAGSTQYEKLK